MPSRLDDLMAQIRDPWCWPAPPTRELELVTAEDLARLRLSADDLRRLLVPLDAEPVRRGARPDTGAG